MKEISSLKVMSDVEIVVVSGGCINDNKGCSLCCTGAYDVYDFIRALAKCEATYCKCHC